MNERFFVFLKRWPILCLALFCFYVKRVRNYSQSKFSLSLSYTNTQFDFAFVCFLWRSNWNWPHQQIFEHTADTIVVRVSGWHCCYRCFLHWINYNSNFDILESLDNIHECVCVFLCVVNNTFRPSFSAEKKKTFNALEESENKKTDCILCCCFSLIIIVIFGLLYLITGMLLSGNLYNDYTTVSPSFSR